MPIYEYKCASCGKITEIVQKFSDKPLTKCSSCSGRLSKLISNCSFHLKGSGWYVTDYKKKDSGWKDKTAEKKSDTTTTATTETPKTETAAAAAPKAEEKKS
jgi:putative FmdB family regulatory protein